MLFWLWSICREKDRILTKDLHLNEDSFHYYKERKLYDLNRVVINEKVEQKLNQLKDIKQQILEEKKAQTMSSPF